MPTLLPLVVLYVVILTILAATSNEKVSTVTTLVFQWRHTNSGLTLGLRPANERRRYKVTPFLIGWAQT